MDPRQVGLGCQTFPVQYSLEPDTEGDILHAYNDGVRHYHWSPRSPNNYEADIAPPTPFYTNRLEKAVPLTSSS
jgi:hypothetical protein